MATMIFTDAGRAKFAASVNGANGYVQPSKVLLGSGHNASPAGATALAAPIPAAEYIIGAVGDKSAELVRGLSTTSLTVRYTDISSDIFAFSEIGLFDTDDALTHYYSQPTPIFNKATAQTHFTRAIEVQHRGTDAGTIAWSVAPVENATTARRGIAELATPAEIAAGTDGAKVIAVQQLFAALRLMPDAAPAQVTGAVNALALLGAGENDPNPIGGGRRLANFALRELLSFAEATLYDTPGTHIFTPRAEFRKALVIFKGADGGRGGRTAYVNNIGHTIQPSPGQFVTQYFANQTDAPPYEEGAMSVQAFTGLGIRNIGATPGPNSSLTITIGGKGGDGGNWSSGGVAPQGFLMRAGAGGAAGAGSRGAVDNGADGAYRTGSVTTNAGHFPDFISGGGGGGGAGGDTIVRQGSGTLYRARGGWGAAGAVNFDDTGYRRISNVATSSSQIQSIGGGGGYNIDASAAAPQDGWALVIPF